MVGIDPFASDLFDFKSLRRKLGTVAMDVGAQPASKSSNLPRMIAFQIGHIALYALPQLHETRLPARRWGSSDHAA
jgi:hypothetical protein